MSVRLHFPSIPGIMVERRVGLTAIPLLALAVLLAGCSLESPKAPRWTIQATVPLADRLYDLPYIVAHADQPELVWDSVSGARFEVVRTLDTIFVGENIDLGDVTQSFADSLGVISLQPQQTLTAEIMLAELYNGPTGDIPAFSTEVSEDFESLAEIRQARIARGNLRIRATNGLGLVIDSLEIAVRDLGTAADLGRLVVSEAIAPLENRFADLNLAGKTVSGWFGFTARMHTPGGHVNSTEDKFITIAAFFPDSVSVSEAVAAIPQTRRMVSDTVDFSRTIQASDMTFRRGRAEVLLNNGSHLGFNVELNTPNLKHNGSPLHVTGYVAPSSQVTLAVELANTVYDNPTGTHAPLRVELSLLTDGSAQPVEVSATDRFNATVQIFSPIVESMTGILPPTVQDVEDLRAEVDLPEGFEQAGLAAGELRLELLNSLPFPGTFAFELTGDRAQSLSLRGNILPATAGEPLASAIEIANAASLLQPIPAIIHASGTVTYGDGVTFGTVRAADFLVPSFRLIAPLSLYLDGVHHRGEIEGARLSGEGDDLSGRLGSAAVFTEFENHLPFGVTIEVRLADHRADLPDNPDVILGPSEVSPASVGPDGRTTAAAFSSPVFSITADQTHVFEADSVFISEDIRFFTAGGRVVTLRDSDYIHWRALLQIEAAIGGRD